MPSGPFTAGRRRWPPERSGPAGTESHRGHRRRGCRGHRREPLHPGLPAQPGHDRSLHEQQPIRDDRRPIVPHDHAGVPSTTAPYGNVENTFDLCEMAITAGANYVARWTTAHPQQCIQAMENGVRKKGLSFIEIMVQCPTHWKEEPAKMIKGFAPKGCGSPGERGQSLKKDQFWVGELTDRDGRNGWKRTRRLSTGFKNEMGRRFPQMNADKGQRLHSARSGGTPRLMSLPDHSFGRS